MQAPLDLAHPAQTAISKRLQNLSDVDRSCATAAIRGGPSHSIMLPEDEYDSEVIDDDMLPMVGPAVRVAFVERTLPMLLPRKTNLEEVVE